jgi:hypothetical protein
LVRLPAALRRFPNPPENFADDAPTPVPLHRNRFLVFLFWPLVWALNLFGLADLIMAAVQAVRTDLPSVTGQLGAAYAIPILYVPALFWAHLLVIWLLLRPAHGTGRSAGAPMSLAATE